ncbi:MAG: hypothetical protein DHS20C18_51700 [Saprospiraceae bacterium]|nr:MAG: hypothetical protein DHS20C18_51700 [Saprospiraceae bacterium]
MYNLTGPILAVIFWGTLLVISPKLYGQTYTVSNPSACNLSIDVPDINCELDGTLYQPITVNVIVNGVPGTTLGVDVFLSEVRLVMRHTWMGDLSLVLVSPGGVSTVITSGNGAGDNNLGNPEDSLCNTYARFVVESCFPVEDGEPPYTDVPYLPSESFYQFNDETTNPNGTWKLLICDYQEGDVGSLEFVELLFEPISCLPISAVQVLNIDTTTVSLDWQPTEFCGTTILEYGPPGFTPGVDSSANTGAIVITDCRPFNLDGLNPDTEYELYIRRYCEITGHFSINSCPVTFQTGCQPPPLSLRETFDDQTNCSKICGDSCLLTGAWRNGPANSFDWIVNNGNTPTTGTGPGNDITGGGKYVYLETSEGSCPDNAEAFLYSPCMILNKQGTDTCHLSFYYHMFGLSIGSLGLEVSTDGGFNWDNIWEKRNNQGNQWIKTYISLSDYEDGLPIQLRFVGKRGLGTKGDIAIDEITVYGSEILGFPSQIYFVDADNDGYGRASLPVLSCLSDPPFGFTDNSEDCNDNNPMINPGMQEIPCDGIDNNCNNATINDDAILPPPVAFGDTVCSGETVKILAIPDQDYDIFWTDSPTEYSFVSFDTCFFPPNIPENNSSVPIEYRFYAGQIKDFCLSQEFTEVVIVVNPKPAVSTAEMPEICPGVVFDLASLTIEDANFTGGEITFHSGTPATSFNQLASTLVSPEIATDYYYLMTSPDGCTDEGTVSLGVKPGPDLSFLPADSFSLCLETRTTVAVLPTGGAGGYTYFWSTGSSQSTTLITASSQADALDVYRVTVTDAEGCFSVDSIMVTTTNSIDSVKVNTTSVTSCMGTDGSIRVIPLNGLGPFDYNWSSTNGTIGSAENIPDTLLISGLAQGAYRITITDDSNQQCEFRLRSVLVQGPNAVVGVPQIDPVSCYGAMDGEICLNISGGTGATYDWSTGDSTLCISNLSGGLYSVTITNGSCETILSDLSVPEPDSLMALTNSTSPSCFDTSNGAIDLVVFGGTAPFVYSWSNQSVNQHVNNLSAGLYTVTVTDFNGCQIIETVVLEAPDTLQVAIDSLSNMSCLGIADGYIRVAGSGGRPPYRYLWENGITSPVLSNLTAGVYSLTITDFNNCQVTETIEIIEPESLTVQIIDFTQPQCQGDFTGIIEATAGGGTPPYTYIWNPGGEDGPVLSNLGVGNYSLVVSDVNNCLSDTLYIQLDPLNDLNLQINITAPPCVGPESGSISLIPNGASPFSYNWERGDTTATITNVNTGNYPLTITDSQGCLYDTTIQVNAPQVFNVTVAKESPSCFGVDDGFIDPFIVYSGQSTFSFLWENGSMESERANLTAGAYYFSITDQIGCRFQSDTLQLTYPEPLSLQVEEIGEIRCNGDSTGYIELALEGGTPPYSINWIGLGAQTEDVANLVAGSYRVVIFDTKDCPLDTTFVLTQPNRVGANIVITNGLLCDPLTQDTVTATGFGGTPPYTYSWSNGEEGPVISGVPSGEYSMTITDANGCQRVYNNIKVRDRIKAIQLDTFYVTDISCYGDNDASMTAIISGGSGNFYYSFNPSCEVFTSSDSVSCTNLPLSPDYSVTIIDLETGCVVYSEELDVIEPAPLVIRRDSVDFVQCFGGSDGGIFVTVMGGTMPYEYVWSDTDGPVAFTEDLPFASEGIYTLEVTDAHGCTATLVDSSVVNLNEVIRIDTTIITDVKCKGESTGAIDVTIVGGNPPYQFHWSPGNSLEEDLTSVPAGIYALTVTDEDTCRALFANLQILQPTTEIIGVKTIVPPLCHNTLDGSLSLAATGGAPPYEYQWTQNGTPLPGQVDPDLENVGAGQYVLILTDTNDCVKTYTFDLVPPDSLSVEIQGVNPNPPQTQGSVMAVVEGGTPGYSYLWNTGDTLPVVEHLPEGLYSVMVVDTNGCVASDSLFLVPVFESDLVQESRLFPNPVREKVQILLNLNESLNLDLSVMDSRGSVLMNRRFNAWKEGVISLDISPFPSGTYWVLIRTGGKQLAVYQMIVNY